MLCGRGQSNSSSCAKLCKFLDRSVAGESFRTKDAEDIADIKDNTCSLMAGTTIADVMDLMADGGVIAGGLGRRLSWLISDSPVRTFEDRFLAPDAPSVSIDKHALACTAKMYSLPGTAINVTECLFFFLFFLAYLISCPCSGEPRMNWSDVAKAMLISQSNKMRDDCEEENMMFEMKLMYQGFQDRLSQYAALLHV